MSNSTEVGVIIFYVGTHSTVIIDVSDTRVALFLSFQVLVWDTLARINEKIFKKVSVVFENVKFLRATVIPAQGG